MMVFILIILLFVSETQNYMFFLATLSRKNDQKYQNFWEKNLEGQCIGMNVKEKVEVLQIVL